MSGCCVYGCTNRYSTGGLKFYRIPRGPRPFQSNRRRLWLQAIKRLDWNEDIIKNARVCSAHFISGEASLDSSSPDFVPSVFMYTKQSQNPNAKMDRYHRKRRRADTAANQRVTSETPEQECSMDPEQERSMDHCPAEEDIPVPKREYNDLNLRYSQLQEEYVHLRQEFDTLRAENVKLKEELQKSTFSYTTVKCNIGQLNFLTGLTSVVFAWLITKMMGSLERIHNKLTVSKTTISNILRSGVPAMALVLKPLIKWPTRPSNLTSRAQTWSNYKHNNTIKYLIGITPAGAISFLSPGWGGRVSDKQITKESGFLKLLEPRDEVLADRGFLIRDELAAYGATLRIPHFTKGKKQLSAQEVDTSRQLSRVRIHVERVIGRWKNFKILQTVIPLSQVDILDDVVIVCGALTNLCKSVVPK
ncbi:52 kDa repressor of the inhibitor of the protein kinase [Dissostichus eleginoides]|uniref:52 kDa repressor of the inhibitor of the protein kinase n=1 Tax=Dissostichus eleginoides TaxID=100907 RepID=A0AAD9BJN5_DISEL|nr:52 kDa repressor of the inhibitor of the protein kinase [Dissostichus eleginoides]